MVHQLNYSRDILETFGVLSSFNLAEAFWENYESFAVQKIKNANLKLRGALFYIKGLSHKQAEKELQTLSQIMPVIEKVRNMLEPVKGKEFKNFKDASEEFFETVDVLYESLIEIADVHSSYKSSIPVLKADWDSDADAHWDNY
ncbi:MAG: hypothetical protein WD048_00060 [Chitinophagales bacterium]